MEIYLSGLFEQTDIYLLIVVRLLGFFVVMPIFGGANIPTITKIGFSVIVAGIILSTQTVGPIVYNDNIIAYILLVMKEIFVGLILGFTVYMVFSTLYLAGQLVDFQIGFSMVNVFDPVSQMQVPVTGNLYYFLVSALLVLTNSHYTIFRALFYSYKVVPIGGSTLLSNKVFETVLIIISSYFVIAFKIALPIIGSILILDTALGLMTRTAPQVNIFSVGMGLKLLVGLTILFTTTDTLIPISDYIFNDVYKNLINIIEGLMP